MTEKDIIKDANIKDTLKQVMKSLPKDMQLPTYYAEDLINKFMSEVSEPLQKLISSMTEKVNETNDLSDADRQLFTQRLTSLMLPYIQSITNDIDKQ